MFIVRDDVCLKHDELRPGKMLPCEACDATGRVQDLWEHVHRGVWVTCWQCRGARVVYLVEPFGAVAEVERSA
jgi:hypothetical protein